jgi:bifunctional non-homologous end joining protein LigD
VEISNPDKVLFPDVELTKAELVHHYESVGESMLPFVSDSPLTLERYPSGIGSKGFRQKNASKHFPDLIGRVEVPKREGGVTTYPTVDSVEGLTYLANQGTITFHPWTSRLSNLDTPLWLVIDLDPSEDDLDGVRIVADATHAVLEGLGLPSQLVTSGSKGFHIWVAIEPEHDFEVVGRCAKAIGGLIVAATDSATDEFLKKERDGRVFVDWMRNGFGASVASPYSVRSKPGAPVATPVPWEMLNEVEPQSWNVRTIADRPDVTFPPPISLPANLILEAAEEAGVDLDREIDRFGRER